MAMTQSIRRSQLFVDREVIDRFLRKQDDERGTERLPLPTAQEIRQQMIDQGICPEDDEFSRGIIAMREE